MKKLISLILSMVFVFSISVAASAAEPTLENLANNTIDVTTVTQESGAVVTTYDNLDVFVEAAQEQFPDVSDYDLGKFIMEYMGQDSTGIPEFEVLMLLDYDNISTSTSYVRVNSEGESTISSVLPRDVWTSNDGCLKLETNFTKTSTSGNYKYFNVWTIATWITYPSICIKDILAIGSTGLFDSSYSEFGYVYQNLECRACGHTTSYDRYVSVSDNTDGDLSLIYSSDDHLPAIRFNPGIPRCTNCTGYNDSTYFRAFIRYSTIINDLGNIYPSYGHQTLGAGTLSYSVDLDGKPSFSAGLGTYVVPYDARALTLS